MLEGVRVGSAMDFKAVRDTHRTLEHASTTSHFVWGQKLRLRRRRQRKCCQRQCDEKDTAPQSPVINRIS